MPLVNPGSPIAEILVDGKQAAVTNETGQVSLVLRGPADHTLRLRFSAPASMRPGPGTASLQLPRAAGHVLELRAGDKLAGITVDGATMSERPDKTHVAVLTNDYLTVRYTVALEQAEAVEKNCRRRCSWTSTRS
ncbi:MAG: hypothetical protein M5R36_24315 [Deltaproteobacteria bacterium]|nr:hypothetical protein [Deltaproteobacteria bacterium]